MRPKEEIRAIVKEKLTLLTETELKLRSDAICNMLEGHKSFKKARTIMSFWPLPKEVDIRPINELYCFKKLILLPTVSGVDLKLKPFEGYDRLVIGKYGILEPTTNEYINIQDIDLIIVPGTAFDRENHRIGKGKGYYDRFIKNTNAYKIGICFGFQMFGSIPIESHDVPVDEVLWA